MSSSVPLVQPSTTISAQVVSCLCTSTTEPNQHIYRNSSLPPQLPVSTMPHGPPAEPILYSFPTTDALIDSLAQFVIKAQKEAVDKKGRFTLALSGGSLPKQLAGLVGRPGIHWDLWCVSHPSTAFGVKNSKIDHLDVE